MCEKLVVNEGILKKWLALLESTPSKNDVEQHVNLLYQLVPDLRDTKMPRRKYATGQ